MKMIKANNAQAKKWLSKCGLKVSKVFLICLIAISLSACENELNQGQDAKLEIPTPSANVSAGAAVDSARLLAAQTDSSNWMSHGRDYGEQRHSSLDAINDETVKELGLAWSFDFGEGLGIEATSLVVDGVMFTTGSWSQVYALDARTGELLWHYDPKVSKARLQQICCGPVNRGVAVWEGQVFVGTLDGRLIALDAVTGDVNWSKVTVDQSKPYSITGAPRVVKGLVIIGNGGAEFGVRGFIAAYDHQTGDQVWKFYTVPGDPDKGFENEAMRMAAETWTGEHWLIGGGGGTVWDSMAYDAELDLLYFGVGNGTPWNREIRSPDGGDNLFLSSIVAVRPATGEYVWHYQTTPGESWDYTATQHIILADMEIEGKQRKVLMQAPKNGFFYVLDRVNGELISANNYTEVTWATHIDKETGRPVEVQGARYIDKPFTLVPAFLGGHNWHPMSFNPETGLVYIPILSFPAVYGQPQEFKYRDGLFNVGLDPFLGSLPDDQAIRNAVRPLFKGALLAWDPRTNSEVWRVDHSGPWNGGTLTTAGNLVFQGTADGKFEAFRADSGKQLWDFATQTGVVAAPMTYQIDGEQYVSIAVGWGGTYAYAMGEFVQPESLPNVARVLTFKLGGSNKLPSLDWNPTVTFNPPEQIGDADALKLGEGLYGEICSSCHGASATSGLLIPDLRGSAFIQNAQAWNSVVLEGSLADRGMASYRPYLTEEQSEAIRSYVIKQSHLGKEVQSKVMEAAKGK